jgi:hypothetical protein
MFIPNYLKITGLLIALTGKGTLFSSGKAEEDAF